MLSRSYLVKFEKARKEGTCSHRFSNEKSNMIECSCGLRLEKKDINIVNEYNIPVLVDLIKIYCGIEDLDLLDINNPNFERDLMSLYYSGIFPNLDPLREEKEKIKRDKQLVNRINEEYYGDTFKEPESGKYYCCTDAGFLLLDTRGDIMEFRNTHKPTHSSITVRALGADMSYTVNINKTLARRLCAHEVGYMDDKQITCKHCGLELPRRVMKIVNESNYLEAIDYLKFFIDRSLLCSSRTIEKFKTRDFTFIEELLLKVSSENELMIRDGRLQDLIIEDLLELVDRVSDRQLILVGIKDPSKIDSSESIKRYISNEYQNILVEFIVSRKQNLDYNINVVSRDLFYTTIMPLLKQK